MRFVQHHITTTNFYSAGRIGEFAKSDGRDEVEEDAGYDAERDLRGLHFQVNDSHSVVGYGLTMKVGCMHVCDVQQGEGEDGALHQTYKG